VAAEPLEQFLGRSVEARWQDYACNAPNIWALRKTTRQPSEPVGIRLAIVVEESDDVAKRCRYSSVTRP
jgi:hypothetical protein